MIFTKNTKTDRIFVLILDANLRINIYNIIIKIFIHAKTIPKL